MAHGSKTPTRNSRGRKRRLSIKGAIKHPGQLHRDLGVPQGQTIPASKMAAALRGDYGPKVAQRARFAQTLKRLRGR